MNVQLTKRSAFNLVVTVGISVFCQAFFILKVLINLITSLELVSLTLTDSLTDS